MTSFDLYDQMAAAAAQDGPAEVAALLARAPTVILYGAGGAGQNALRVLRARGIKVQCFLDQSARPGDERQGVPVFWPDDPAFGQETRQDVPVIVSVFNPYVDGEALGADLRDLGWQNVIAFEVFHRAYAAELGDRYWLTDLAFYRDQAPQMRAAAGLWADERSRAIYDATLRYRWQGKRDPVLSPDMADPYFPADMPPWKAPARFVDCGAYNGDTLEQIRARGFALAAVAAFEPDPAHLGKLTATLRELAAGDTAKQVLLWPCAVHATTTRLRFAAGLGMASGLRLDGDEVVQAMALDDALPGFHPTLLKMDIEGAEYEALLGARALIQRDRPGLAICVYHRPSHLWQIPLLIQSWDLGYRFWLRSHAHSGYEMVLYAQAERGPDSAQPA
jgi:FkbM family methyltransferase